MRTIKLRRIGAVIIDGLFVSVITAILLTVLRSSGVLPVDYSAAKFESIDAFKSVYMVELVLGIVVAFIMYSIVPILMKGATLGKKILKIRVVSSKCGEASPVQLVIRNFFVYFAIIALVAFVVNPEYTHYIKTVKYDLNDMEAAKEYIQHAMSLRTPLASLLTSTTALMYVAMFIMMFPTGGHKGVDDLIAGTTVEHEYDLADQE